MSWTDSESPGVWKKDGCWCPDEIETAFPWLSSLFPVWATLRHAETWPSCDQYTQCVAQRGVTHQHGRPIEFVPQPSKRYMRKHKSELPPYNEYIATEGKVFTRQENWHDLFNMLIWSALPQTKLAIHEQQHQESLGVRPKPGQARNATQDLLTRLDEGGVLLACTPRWYALLQCEELRYMIWGQWLSSGGRPVPQTRVFTDPDEARRHWCHTCTTYVASLANHPELLSGSELLLGSEFLHTRETPLFPAGCEEQLWQDVMSGAMFREMAFWFVGHGLFEVMLAGRWDVRAGAFLFARPPDWFDQDHATRQIDMNRQIDIDQHCAHSIQDKSIHETVPCVGVPLGVLQQML